MIEGPHGGTSKRYHHGWRPLFLSVAVIVVVRDGRLHFDDTQSMKVDVEGLEPDVIDGARAPLSGGKVRYIMVEFSPRLQNRGAREKC